MLKKTRKSRRIKNKTKKGGLRPEFPPPPINLPNDDNFEINFNVITSGLFVFCIGSVFAIAAANKSL